MNILGFTFFALYKYEYILIPSDRIIQIQIFWAYQKWADMNENNIIQNDNYKYMNKHIISLKKKYKKSYVYAHKI